MTSADARLARLRTACEQRGLDGLYVRDLSNLRWLTAFDGVFDDEPAHALFVDVRRAVLHTDSRYVSACERRAQGTSLTVSAERVSHSAFAANLWYEDTPAADAKLGIESSITLAEYRALQKAFEEHGQYADSLPFVETDGVVGSLRTVKDTDEIARMKEAQAITDAAYTHIIGFMKPGMTEREVQIELEDFMRRHGAEGLAFPSIVATGPHGASPHAIPGETLLEAGQCVVLDFGARARGYCSDMTRTVFLGEPDARLRSAYEAIRAANEQVEAVIKPGVLGKDMHDLAEQVLADAGFGGTMGHSLGHGVGIDIHEEPNLSPRNDAPLVAGNVVTVEPGIYLPGEFGMRLEDFGVVTEEGFAVFTHSTHDMVIL